jgi:hypothetical protein
LPPGVGVPPSGSAEEILDAFLRIPYRKDGAVSEDGRNTLWADPSKSFPGPGLNCSGFMVAASRFLMGVNFTLDEAKRDISSDSGKGAPLGEDWDFGLDAALNLAGGGSVIFPWQGEYGRVEDGRGRPLGLGADVDGEGFVEALGRIVPGKLYFFAVSKPDARFGGGLSYYHNGIAIAARDGGVSLYHATGRGGVNRMRLSTPAGLATFRKYYPPLRSGKRRVVFIEASPPACAGPWAYQAQPPGAPQPQEAPGAPGLQALPNLPPVPPGPRAASIVSGVPGAEAGP